MSFRESLNIKYKEFCTGCGACVQTCHKRALSLITDDQGYYVAYFEKSKCIDCGMCDNICPVSNENTCIVRAETPELYAVQMNDEIRKTSSSGGVFASIATKIIENGGVVFGASWTDDLSVKHIYIESIKDIYKLKSSKYVQSYVGTTYKEAKKFLQDGRKVLYTGTPCQIAGLYAFLKKDYSNLLTIDLLCLYAPSHKYLQSYLRENYGNTVIKVDMRDKENGWKCTNLSLHFEDGRKIVKKEDDIWERAFLNRIMMSRHCNNCKYPRYKRNGDITLGDFWEICSIDTKFDKNGTNAVLVNSPKGKSIYEEVTKEAFRSAKRPINELNGNRICKHKWASPHFSAMRFQNEFPHKGFNESAKKCIETKYDIAILGCWEVRNFGSHLTYFALYNVLRELGNDVIFVGCPSDASYKTKGIPEYFKNIPYKNWEMHPQYPTKKAMRDANKLADTFIVGSDQLWAPTLYKYFGSFAYLDFIHENKRKIAYATSFGSSDWEGSYTEQEEISFLLSRFSDISVRESSGISICRDRFGVKASWQLDPVFLCNKYYYENLIKQSSIDTSDDYIAAYILDCTKEQQYQLEKIAKDLKCRLKILVDPNIHHELDDKIPIEKDYKVEDWLKFIKDSKYVITDSFHGMCFSIIFRKKFVAIKNVRRGAARFEDYGNFFHINDRIFNSVQDMNSIVERINNINYSSIEELLNVEVKNSIDWLITAINRPIKQNSLSVFDVVSIRNENTLDVLSKKNNLKIGIENKIRRIISKLHSML